MDDSLSSLRFRIQNRPSLRYEADLRTDIVAFVKRQRDDGVSQKTIESSLGIKWKTLATWLEPSRPKKSLVPVKVERGVVLRSPSGWSVEGLTMHDLKVLVS